MRQIKSILNNEPPPVQKEFFQIERIDRRQKKRFSHKGRKILVIDDSATVIAMFGKVLRSAGCVVRDAVDAEMGLEIARQEQPELIFLDIVLPGMDGFAALRHIRRDPRTRHIPVIVISGNEQAIEQFYAKRIGANAFMRKPFSRQELFTHVETLVVSGKMRQIEAPIASGSAAPDISDPATVAEIPSPASLPTAQADPAAGKMAAPNSSNMSNTSVIGIAPGEARRQLALMGLRHNSQEQFLAAMKRGDRMAVKLFVVGRGIKV
ncbi:MAG: response regulator [Candidatus Accumulibacter sp.]|nr:response regulator [Accumulibacter sp.]